MNTPQPVAFNVAIGGVLSTGVALLAVFFPGLTPETQGLVIAFGNSIILTGSILIAQRQVTPISQPTLAEGTQVTVTTPAGEPDRVTTL